MCLVSNEKDKRIPQWDSRTSDSSEKVDFIKNDLRIISKDQKVWSGLGFGKKNWSSILEWKMRVSCMLVQN